MEIVLAEPSRIGRRVIGDLLKRRGDVVYASGDGAEALSTLKSNSNISVLITSLELPTTCGIELCWEARILAQVRSPIFVIVMSSNHDRKKLVEALDGGADDFIKKPPAEEELFARLRAAERMIRTQRELMRLAQTDSLTGAYNRRMFFQCLRDASEQSDEDRPLSMVMLDIDYFKSINDRFGHDVGDTVIQRVADLFMQREGIFGRLGGEEFGWALPNRTAAETAALAETARRDVENVEIHCSTGLVRMTSSFGVAAYVAGESIDKLVRRADQALYEAKGAGRNRVRVDYGEPAAAAAAM